MLIIYNVTYNPSKLLYILIETYRSFEGYVCENTHIILNSAVVGISLQLVSKKISHSKIN